MSIAVIRVENLWKQYRLGVIGHGTLYRDLQSWWARMRGSDDPNAKIGTDYDNKKEQFEDERFWALRDISLTICQGDTVGIIGRNGAGKSTLLKILSRVTTPTRGLVKIKGRIASLLEVGTGFHQELTGRENIFLNGTILGMSGREIKQKFDEIVAFSEIQKFIDTPVKRYSSGMYVRLAFAVAAHLEPEILVVDEVLAVGDTEFQKKCLGKMEDVATEGRTVLFVSHNMDAIRSLCARCILLEAGRLLDFGRTDSIVMNYEMKSAGLNTSHSNVFIRPNKPRKKIWISKVVLTDEDNKPAVMFKYGDQIKLRVEINNAEPARLTDGYFVFGIKDHRNNPVTEIASNRLGISYNGTYTSVECIFGPIMLYTNRYRIEIGYGEASPGRLDTWDGDVFFDVVSCDPNNTGKTYDSRSGTVHIPSQWNINKS